MTSPMVNYAQMKIIFTPQFGPSKNLYNPRLMIQAIDHLADNKIEGASYTATTELIGGSG
jgi:hypothetical protein